MQVKSLSMAAALALFAGLAVAAPPGPEGRGRLSASPEERADRLARWLDLSEPQKVEFEARHQQHAEQMKSRLETLRALHERIEEATDANTIGQLVLEARAGKAETEALRAEFREGLKELLTPEQVEKFDSMVELREEFGAERRGRRGFGRRHRAHGEGH